MFSGQHIINVLYILPSNIINTVLRYSSNRILIFHHTGTVTDNSLHIIFIVSVLILTLFVLGLTKLRALYLALLYHAWCLPMAEKIGFPKTGVSGCYQPIKGIRNWTLMVLCKTSKCSYALRGPLFRQTDIDNGKRKKMMMSSWRTASKAPHTQHSQIHSQTHRK